MTKEELEVLTAQNARLRAEMEDLAAHFEAMSRSDQGDAVTWSCAATTIRESLAEIEAETPAESLDAVRAEAATSGARNLAAAFHRAVKAAAPDITYPESDEPLESAVAYIFAQIRAESKSEARREMAEIVAKLVPELRAYIRDGMAAFDTTVDDAVISALDRFRAEAGRERAVQELEALVTKASRYGHLLRLATGPEPALLVRFLRERLEEIAKERP